MTDAELGRFVRAKLKKIPAWALDSARSIAIDIPAKVFKPIVSSKSVKRVICLCGHGISGHDGKGCTNTPLKTGVRCRCKKSQTQVREENS